MIRFLIFSKGRNNLIVMLSTSWRISICALLFPACITTKHLENGQELYIGSEVNLESDFDVRNKKILKEDLEALILPRPNSKFMGLRPKLWLYFKVSQSQETKIGSWIFNKAPLFWRGVGERPLLFTNVSPEKNALLIQNKLFNQGYFNVQVNYSIKKRKRKVFIRYGAKLSEPYTINKLHFPDPEEEILQSINYSKVNSFLSPGQNFNLETLKEERGRIDSSLKNEGYYFFSPDFLLFHIDSTIGDKSIDIYLSLKSELPKNTRRKYRIRNIYIDASYSLGKDSLPTQEYKFYNREGYYFRDENNRFKPDILNRYIAFQPGHFYKRTHHDNTLNNLMSLGSFKFANLDFVEVVTEPQDEEGMLDLYVLLTPLSKRSVRFEVNAVTKSNNFAGPGLNASYKNRNTFKGSEVYVLRVSTGFETQISGKQKGLNSYLLGIDNEFYIPRFYSPFEIRGLYKKYIPKTKLKLGYQVLDRVNYYRLNSLNAGYGFEWKENLRKNHEYNPVTINFVNLSRQSNAFEQLLEQNPFLRRSFEKQFIVGSNYTYTYNRQLDPRFRNPYYFSLNADIAGNMLYAVHSVLKEQNKESGFKIFDLEYAQYARLEADFRYYYKINNKSRIAFRTISGLVVPYGNSVTVPYVKQFFIGGTNSIRAFLPRSIGPGSYETPERGSGNLFIDQTGDIKLESNIEYRFDISPMFKGALFADAGNIWRLNENENKPGGQFESENFYKEIALGTGVGIRIDFSYFVIRLDWAFPLRKPYLPESQRWVFNDLQFDKPDWRKENLILNIAIGYPF